MWSLSNKDTTAVLLSNLMPQKKDRNGDWAVESRQEEFDLSLEKVNLERKGVSLLHRWVNV